MAIVPFESLPHDARVWIFASGRPLDADERGRLLEIVDAFLAQWKAHGAPLAAARDWRYERFLLIGVDESAAGASGCSIDAMVHQLGGLERALGVELLDHGPVLFRKDDRIERLPRRLFADLARRGDVTPETIVFNNTVTRMADVREGRWETPAGSSWHGKAFGLA